MGCATSKQATAFDFKMEVTDEMRKAGIEKTKHTIQSYFAGEPHFTKAMLEEMDMKMTQYKDHVERTGDKDGFKFFDNKLSDDS
jgi:hypothetical protein